MTVGSLDAAPSGRAESPEEALWRPFLTTLPVSGAAISTLGGILPVETVASSDELSARIDELQIDLGEGPCWDAVATGRPVLEPSMRKPIAPRWPAFSEAVREYDDIAALFAFPMRVGPLSIGAVDLYSTSTGPLSAGVARDAGALADLTARSVLRRALLQLTDLEDDDPGPRAVVHQATGMVLAQLDISAADALLVLRGRAFSMGRTVREVARDVVDRQLDFAPREGNPHEEDG